MGDMGEIFNDWKQEKKNLKKLFGIPCPICIVKLPKAQPKILLPGGYCKMHRFKDARDPSIMDHARDFKLVN